MPGPADDEEALWGDVRPEGRRRVLLAALQAFAARGYNGSTTRQIAQLAGMSTAAVYVHYASKAELLFELSRTGHAAVLREVEEAVAAGADPTGRLRGLMETFVAWHARNHTLARVIQYEIGSVAPERFDEIRRLRSDFQRLVRRVIDEGAADGTFAVDDARTTTLALLSLGIDVARWWTPRTTAPARLGERYGDLALRMVGADAATARQERSASR